MKEKKQKKHNENTCRKCGACCLRKVGWRTPNGAIYPVVLDIPCPALDEKTKLCRIYEWRHSNLAFVLRGMNPCFSIKQAIDQKELPDDCPYVPDGYEGMTMDLALLARYRQAKLGDYMLMAGETRRQREAIDKVLWLMDMKATKKGKGKKK